MLLEIRLYRENGGYGFSITGGIDMPVAGDDTAIYVTHIVPGSAADNDGRIQIGDRVRLAFLCLFRVLIFFIYFLYI